MPDLSAQDIIGRIRAKYPAYNDIPDAELAKRVYAKYPDAYPELKGYTGAKPAPPKPRVQPMPSLMLGTGRAAAPAAGGGLGLDAISGAMAGVHAPAPLDTTYVNHLKRTLAGIKKVHPGISDAEALLRLQHVARQGGIQSAGEQTLGRAAMNAIFGPQAMAENDILAQPGHPFLQQFGANIAKMPEDITQPTNATLLAATEGLGAFVPALTRPLTALFSGLAGAQAAQDISEGKTGSAAVNALMALGAAGHFKAAERAKALERERGLAIARETGRRSSLANKESRVKRIFSEAQGQINVARSQAEDIEPQIGQAPVGRVQPFVDRVRGVVEPPTATKKGGRRQAAPNKQEEPSMRPTRQRAPAKKVEPTLPAQSEVDTSQPMFGVEEQGAVPRFDTTYQALEKGAGDAVQQQETAAVGAHKGRGRGARGTGKSGGVGQGKQGQEAAGKGTQEVAQAEAEGPEKIAQAAYKTEEGKVETGANHPEILDRLGVAGYRSRKSRNTPDFGFVTDKGRFVTREEAAKIAEASGQKLTEWEQTKSGKPQAHSDEIAAKPGDETPISEAKVPPAPVEAPVSTTDKPAAAAEAVPQGEAVLKKGQRITINDRDYYYVGKNLEGQHTVRGAITGRTYTLTPEQVSSARIAEKAKLTPEQQARADIAARGGVKGRRAGAILGMQDWRDIGRIGKAKLEGASENVRRAVDASANILSEAAAHTRRTAPEAFHAGLRMVNAVPEAEAGVEKLRSIFEAHGFKTKAEREAIGALLNADKQLARGVTPAIPEARVQAAFATPKMQAFLKDYNPAVEELYREQRQAAGYGSKSLYGKHSKAWMPGVAVDEQGLPYSKAAVGGGAGYTRPAFTPREVPGEVRFTGKGTYVNDPLEAHMNRLMGLHRAAGERRTIAELFKAGALQPVPKDYDGTLTYQGRKVSATRVKLESWGFTPQEMKAIGIPTKTDASGQIVSVPVAMPRKVAAEMEPLFKARMAPYEEHSAFYDRAIMAQLYSLGELGAHMVTLPSVAGAEISKGAAGAVPLINTLRGVKRMLNFGYSAEDVRNANVLAARAGVRRPYTTDPEMTLPAKEGYLASVATKAMKGVGMSESAIAKTKAVSHQPGGGVLYSRRGIFNNIVTGIYKTMKASGASDKEIVEALHRALPSHTKSLEPEATKFLKRLGLASYAGTGRKVIGQAFNPKGGLPTVALRAAGAVAFATLAGRVADRDGKFWWEQGLAPGEYVAGHDTSGKPIVGTISADRISRAMLETPDRVIRAWQAKATPEQQVLEGVAGVASQAIRPFTGGPLASFLQQYTGKAPYVVRNREKYGIDFLDTPTAKLPYTDIDRIWDTVRGMVPAAAYARDTADQYSTTAPRSQKWRVINTWLRRLGQPQFKVRDTFSAQKFERMNEMKRRSGARKAKAKAARED